MMTKTLARFGGWLSILCLACNAAAQSPVALETRTAKLQTLANELQQRGAQERAAVQAYARRLGIPVRRELPNGRVLELQRLLPDALFGQRAVFYITNNVDAADTVSTDEVWPGGSAGLDLDGAGMVVAQWDGGAVYDDHPDLAGRVTHADGATVGSGHSTHVAGTLIGAGDWLLPQARGMAFAADLDAYDWQLDTAEMAAAAAGGQLISNHSYGIAAGWIYTGISTPPDTWLWIGGSDPADVEDPYFGYYDSQSQLWDQIAYDAPYYLIVKAAGNDRSDFGAAPGEEYTVIDQDGNELFTSTLPRNPDCWPAGYDCLPTNSVAKNVLTVGAVDDLLGGYSPISGPSSVLMSDFSSWGPTDDGRIKPDLVGNGVFLYSTWPDYPYYALAAGTSMSAPNVTGSLLLLQQHYENLHGPGNYLRAATLKALAIHTADEAGDSAGPDYEFGWGLLNTKSAAEVISEEGADHQIVEASLAQGAFNDHVINVADADSVVTATLVWADPPATPVPLSLDPPDPMLVNDLDLRIHRGPATWFPWVLNPGSPAAAATTGDNVRDNVEQVKVSGATTGPYTVRVTHKGTLADGPQDYALILSVEPPPPVGSGLLIDEDFSGGLPAGWSVQTNYGVSWTINDPVPGHPRLDNLTGGSGKFAIVYNNFGDSLTSLRTPVLDLSANDAAVLRFNSAYPYYDTFETLNVDVSTNGGSTWQGAWQWMGFNPFPTLYTLDLSSRIAGASAAMIRFRWDSSFDGGGDTWQVDNVELEVFGGEPPPGDPPGPAANPSPSNGAAGQSVNTDLAWTAGALTDSHDVYFGTGNPLTGGDFQGSQAGTTFDPGSLEYATTYYWRIDEVNGDGTTAGSTWQFTTESAPLASLHLAGLSGSAIPGSRGRWTASVTIAVADDGGMAEAGVLVDGEWSGGTNGGATCTTNAQGLCTVEKANLKLNVSSVTFSVTNLTKPGFTYAPVDNVGGDSVAVNATDTDQTPIAVNDSYQTEVGVAVAGNVMNNDDPGDEPATIESYSQPASGSLSLAADGAFTYTPNPPFEGDDSFTYRLVDQDGDLSNTATVTVSVAAEEPPPPPPPPDEPSLTVTPYKDKGIQHVQLDWQNFAGTSVTISRDGSLLAASPVPNSGSHIDNLGVKGGGVTYTYQVCETAAAVCASASATF
jgi:hypothetical protein